MKEKRAWVVAATNLVIAGVIVWQILEVNPSTRIYIRHYAQWVRWYAWMAMPHPVRDTPQWLREAMQVRGFNS